MKVQIDIDADLWAKFKAKVHHEGKTLGSVVPTIFEPALRAYVDPTAPHKNTCDKCGREITGIEWLSGDGMVKLCNDCMTFPEPTQTPPTTTIETAPIEFTGPTTEKKLVAVERIAPALPTVKRCDLCDQVVDRLFASGGKRVCYVCWRSALTAGQ